MLPHSAPVLVGNDIVDLTDPRTHGKAEDGRFLDRVCAPEERRAVLASPDPTVALWVRWAAKEAAYKIVSKRLGEPPTFAHRDFVVRGDSVEYAGVRYPFVVSDADRAIHVVATHRVAAPRAPAPAVPAPAVPANGEESGRSAAVAPHRAQADLLDREDAPWVGSSAAVPAALLARFTEREADAIHSRASAAVRLAARASLAGVLEISEERIEIVCAPGPTGRRPPHVLVDGAAVSVDVSLSHHGRWIAWAITA